VNCAGAGGAVRSATMQAKRPAGALNLIFDADDTLWDSNIHFLGAETAFVALLARVGISDHGEIRAAMRRHELRIIESHGYGRRPYVIALHQVIAEVAPPHHHENLRSELERIGEHLIDRHCELLPGVAATLGELVRRHRLLLFTKGDPREQLRKLDRSGLRPLFTRVGVPVEKDPGTYRLLIAQAELDPERTFMIGNSPRSDINPALKAGLRAVFIAHPHTWELEHEEIDHTNPRVMAIGAFPHLLEVF
jgi:putative hydrolase of the HAD superfamily